MVQEVLGWSLDDDTPWRNQWPVYHPDRVCFTCGSAPIDRYRDGSPKYACGPHPPLTPDPATLDWTRYDGIEVILTSEEMARALKHGQDSVELAESRGMRMKFQAGESRLAINTRGYAAELAAGHATGLEVHWLLLPPGYRKVDKKPDLGDKVEVRSARWPSGRLWADRDERIDRYYLLVIGVGPRFTVVGWLPGEELMVPERWEKPPAVKYPGWFAKRYELHPLPLPPDA